MTERLTYSQDWKSYNLAQTREKEHVLGLLRALCEGIRVETRRRRGNQSVPLHTMVFACAAKVYGMLSGRRSASDMRRYRDDGLLQCAPNYNTIARYMGDPRTTPILRALVRESSSPLADLETVFAVDSTGFATGMYDRYFDFKHGGDRRREMWMKAHVIVGTATHVVTDIVVTDGRGGDSPRLTELLTNTAERFRVLEVLADKAYLSRKNLSTIAGLGAMPYIPFRSNNIGEGPEIWRRMYHYFMYRGADFAEHYHQRSNVEAVFSAVKRKFGHALRSKSSVAQENELLCKFLCHNLCVIVSVAHELGIEAEFWRSSAA